MGDQQANDRRWGPFVIDLEHNFRKPFRDAYVNYTAFEKSVDIKGLAAIDVCKLATWCTHHKLNYELDTRNSMLIVRLLSDESFDVDKLMLKEFTYAAFNKQNVVDELKQVYPRDWHRIERLLMPFVYNDDFKCMSHPAHDIKSFGRDIQILLNARSTPIGSTDRGLLSWEKKRVHNSSQFLRLSA